MHTARSLLLASFLVAAPGVAAAQSTFETLGLQDLVPTDVSPDGSVVVGTSIFGSTVWRYDDVAGFLDLAGYGGNPAVSDDGTIVEGDILDGNGIVNTALWTAQTGWQIIGPYPGVTTGCPDLSDGYNMNGDGTVVVGLGWNVCTATAFRWDPVNGMVDLGALGTSASRANGLDDAGDLVVGWTTATTGNRTPTIWVNGVGQQIGSLDPNDPLTGVGECYVATRDGSQVYGESNTSLFRWTSAGGLEDLGKLEPSLPADRAFPAMVSDDGNVVVGASGDPFFGNPFRAFYYTPDLGIVDLRQHLLATGATIPATISLDHANAVSADGKTVVGWGFDTASGRFEVWRATVGTIDPPCGGNDVATATFRADAAGVNRTGLTADRPVMGTTWTATVANNGTGSTFAGIAAYSTPLDLPTSIGSLLVNVGDPAGELLQLAPQEGSTMVTFSVFVPLDANLCGFAFSVQGLSYGGGGGLALHNAYDCVVGDV